MKRLAWIRAVVDEAKKAGGMVQVHAVSSKAMVAAIDAGVPLLVHLPNKDWMSKEDAKKLAASGTKILGTVGFGTPVFGVFAMTIWLGSGTGGRGRNPSSMGCASARLEHAENQISAQRWRDCGRQAIASVHRVCSSSSLFTTSRAACGRARRHALACIRRKRSVSSNSWSTL
jgi:hypothetical protein